MRSLTPWLVGFLIGACMWLWTFAPGMHRPSVMLSGVETRKSPMDMPNWYKAELDQGARYIEIGPMRQIAVDAQQKQTKRKAATVRGYW